SALAMRFLDRVRHLPRLGLGVSTEYGAGDGREAIDVLALRTEHPEWAGFLEIGVETARGLDRHAEAWAARGWPATYHYRDINLDEPEDFDAEWVADVHAITARLRPAWRCGDAALWHLGRRERGHMLLLPPVLAADAARAIADRVTRLRDLVVLEAL